MALIRVDKASATGLHEVWFAARFSGAGNHFHYVNNQNILTGSNNLESLSAASEFFTAAANTLTAIKACNIIKSEDGTVTTQAIAVGDTIAVNYGSSGFGEFIVAVV